MKTHHYIISFDPKDAVENGLTMERAQALGLQFCKDNFPAHPAIVCTHPDGHNHSGNIHVHIVIGSIRIREVERKPYMQKPRDWLEGMKHSSTAQTMRHLRVEVMELCEGAGLYQIDLLNGSKERVSEAEYWARRRGQLKLDLANAALTVAGQQPRQKKFETVKVACRGEAPPSVRRAEYYAHGVDVADELSPGFRDRFFREELHIPDYLLENLGKAKPEEQAEIFEEIKNYVPKPKKVKPNKVTVKQAEKAASNTIDENYDVPQKFLELYYRLHNAESLMRKSWEVTFDLNPKLLTHPEQVKVLRFALKPHLEFLKTLDEVLAESSSESSKTA